MFKMNGYTFSRGGVGGGGGTLPFSYFGTALNV